MYAKADERVSNPVGEEQVVPMTRLRESLELSWGRPRIGDLEDLEGRPKNGEFEGVSFRRPWEGVAAMIPPLTLGEEYLVSFLWLRKSTSGLIQILQ